MLHILIFLCKNLIKFKNVWLPKKETYTYSCGRKEYNFDVHATPCRVLLLKDKFKYFNGDLYVPCYCSHNCVDNLHWNFSFTPRRFEDNIYRSGVKCVLSICMGPIYILQGDLFVDCFTNQHTPYVFIWKFNVSLDLLQDKICMCSSVQPICNVIFFALYMVVIDFQILWPYTVCCTEL
jgi:hypothetical protein